MRLEVLMLVALCGGALYHAGFKRLPGVGHYKIHYKRRSWEDAKSVCEQEDAHLVIINSEQEFLAVKNFMQRYGEPSFLSHAGFHDKFDDGHFIDLFANPVTSAAYNAPWEGGQTPMAQEDKNCGAFGGFDNPLGGGYSIQSCQVLLPYLCERQRGYKRRLTHPFRKLYHTLTRWP